MHPAASSLAEVTYEDLQGEYRISKPASRRGGVFVVDEFLELLARLEVGDLLGGHVNARAGLRIAPLPRPSLPHAEAAEPAQLDLLVAVERLDDRLEHGVHDHLGVLLRQLRDAGDLLDEF